MPHKPYSSVVDKICVGLMVKPTSVSLDATVKKSIVCKVTNEVTNSKDGEGG